jgi:hypothetical protein
MVIWPLVVKQMTMKEFGGALGIDESQVSSDPINGAPEDG